VLPTAHYAMGGIPTDVHGRVIMDGAGTIVDGLYAAGECACVSVHGANRLGTNSLLDLVVFGRRAGQHIGDYVKQADMPQPVARRRRRCPRRGSPASPTAHPGPHGGHITDEMQTVMMEKVGIYRNEKDMQAAVDTSGAAEALPVRARPGHRQALQHRPAGNHRTGQPAGPVPDHGRLGPQPPGEPRGPQPGRFSERDDDNWLKHTLAYLEGDTVRLDYKAVDTSIWEPKPRTY
jgi:succinate dehydrogenase / fumarate reductase flavoprotein subunit